MFLDKKDRKEKKAIRQSSKPCVEPDSFTWNLNHLNIPAQATEPQLNDILIRYFADFQRPL